MNSLHRSLGIAFISLAATLCHVGAGEIHAAAAAGRLDTVKALLAQNPALVRAQDEQRRTPLHLAASGGHVDVLNALLAAGAQVDAISRISRTPLSAAASAGQTATAQVLLGHGASLFGPPPAYVTPLHWAAAAGRLETTKLLLERGAKLDVVVPPVGAFMSGTPLHCAAQRGHADEVRLLLEHGADPMAGDRRGQTPVDGALASGLSGTGAAIAVLLEHGASLGSPLFDFAAKGDDAALAKLLSQQKGATAEADNEGRTALFWAATAGHTSTVRLLLKRRADPNTTARKAGTPLHAAVAGGYQDVAEILLGSGAMIDAQTTRQETPLHLAASAGNLALVGLLIAHRSPLDGEDAEGWTPLHCAAYRGHNEVTGALLDAGAPIEAGAAKCHSCIRGEQLPRRQFRTVRPERGKMTPLHLAITQGQLGTVKLLLARGADVNATDEAGWNPLHWACRSGQKELAALLLDKGADLNAATAGEKRTALHLATAEGQREVVALLAARAPPLDAKDSEGLTALALAARERHDDVAQFLRATGADSDTKAAVKTYAGGETELHRAASSGSVEEVRRLLGLGADPNAADAYLLTPLHNATVKDRADVTEALLAAGAAIDPLDKNGMTPLLEAAERGNKTVLPVLVAHGAGLDRKNNRGETALHLAARKDHGDCVRILTEAGADVNLTTPYRASPLSLVAERGDTKTADVLIQHGASVNPAEGTDLPLLCAINVGQRSMVDLLLAKAARFPDHATVLELGIRGKTEQLEELLNRQRTQRSEGLRALVYGSGGSAFHRFAALGFTKPLRMLIDHGWDANELGARNRTALHAAATAGRADAIEILAEAGANVNAVDQSGRSPLHDAASNGHIEAVTALLNHGANPAIEARIPQGETPLGAAQRNGHAEVVSLLIKRGAEPSERATTPAAWRFPIVSKRHENIALTTLADDRVPLLLADSASLALPPFRAALQGDAAELGRILRAAPQLVHAHDEAGWTLLHWAVARGHTEAAASLLACGAKLDARTSTNWTPLHLAVFACHCETVQFLLYKGADATAAGPDGVTPATLMRQVYQDFQMRPSGRPDLQLRKVDRRQMMLLLAVLQGHRPVADFTDAGRIVADDEPPVRRPAPPPWDPAARKPPDYLQRVAGFVHKAAREGDVAALRTWVLRGPGAAQVLDSGGWRPLHRAGYGGHASAVAFLLEHGAELDAPVEPRPRSPALQYYQSRRAWEEAGKTNRTGCTALHLAAERGSVEVVQLLIQKGAAVAARNAADQTPLHAAAANGHTAVLKALQTAGADIGTADRAGETPLHLAAAGGHAEAMAALLAGGARMEALDSGSRTPLHLAAQQGHLESVNALVAAGADILAIDDTGAYPSELAIEAGRVDVAQSLQERERKLPQRDLPPENRPRPEDAARERAYEDFALRRRLYDANGKGAGEMLRAASAPSGEPVHAAAIAGDTKQLQAVLRDRPGCLNARDPDGWTPLHWAVLLANRDIVRVLIAANADLDATAERDVPEWEKSRELSTRRQRPWCKDTPLHFATRSGRTELAALLVEAGAALDARDLSGWLPLHRAADHGSVQMTRDLLAAGAQVDARILRAYWPQPGPYRPPAKHPEWEDQTALHLAVRARNRELVLLLLDKGASDDVQDARKQTPLHYAAADGSTALVGILLDRGADPNAQIARVGDSQWWPHVGQTPVHRAALTGHAETLSLLLEHGGDIGVRDKAGQTVLEAVVAHGLNQIRLGPPDDVRSDNARACAAPEERMLEVAVLLVEHGADFGADARLRQQLLRSAIHSGSAATVRKLLDRGANVNGKGTHGETPLHWAADSPAIAKLLIAQGADVNAHDEDSGPPLVSAALLGQRETGAVLLAGGAAIVNPVIPAIVRGDVAQFGALLREKARLGRAADEGGWTPLHYAVAFDQRDLAAKLLALKVDVDAMTRQGLTPLHLASGYGPDERADVCKLLLESGAGANAMDRGNLTPLHYAVARNRLKTASELLVHHADPNLRARGRPSLFPAVAGIGNGVLAELLLANGTDTNPEGSAFLSPLMIAERDGNSKMMALLIANGGTPGTLDMTGTSPLSRAVAEADLGLVNALLAAGADPNQLEPETRETPLHAAAAAGHAAMVRTLLERGANPNAVAITGGGERETPLQLALTSLAKEKQQVVDLLLAKGANPNVKVEGSTPLLHVAVRLGDSGLLESLLAHGADVRATDDDGQTALDVAAQQHRRRIARLLRNVGATRN